MVMFDYKINLYIMFTIEYLHYKKQSRISNINEVKDICFATKKMLMVKINKH